MSTPLRFFRERSVAEAAQQYLQDHSIKTFIRSRDIEEKEHDHHAYGFDLFALREEDVENARLMLTYEYGEGEM
jgi:hypothetical protein